jgi:hypothetical protein
MLAAKLAQALGGRHAVLTEVVDRAVQLERMRRRLASGGGDSEAGAA